MKIIKPGRKITITHDFTCPTCGCEFQAGSNECLYLGSRRDGYSYTHICPTENCLTTCYSRVSAGTDELYGR